MISCATLILERNILNSNIYICSDSQAALRALLSPRISSKLIAECRDKLNKLCSSNSVTLLWVPGHSDIEGNERADELARNGSEHPFVGPPPAVGVSINFGKGAIKALNCKKLTERWSTVTTCRQTKLFIEGPNRNLSRFLLGLRKTELKSMIGVLTGHGHFNKHLTTIGIRSDPICECCLEAIDTAEHFICECPAFSRLRHTILSSHFLPSNELKKVPWKNILRFIRASERFIVT